MNRASRAIADSDAALGVAKLVVPLPPLTFALASHNGHCAARRVGEEGGDALTPFAALETLLKQRARSRAGPPATGHRQDSCGIVELRGKGSQEHVGSEDAQDALSTIKVHYTKCTAIYSKFSCNNAMCTYTK